MTTGRTWYGERRMDRDDLLIGGRFVKPATEQRIEVVSPIDEQCIGSVPHASPADVDAAVSASRLAFEQGPWPRMSVHERGAYLLRMADLLGDVVVDAVRVQIEEMGGPSSFINAITRGSLDMIGAEIAVASALKTNTVRTGMVGPVLVAKDPVGVVAAIIPWNGPFYQTLDTILPGLLTGCPVIVKPSPEAPLTGYFVADAAVAAGLPEGVLSVLPGDAATGEQLVTHPGVNRITFTGSEPGRRTRRRLVRATPQERDVGARGKVCRDRAGGCRYRAASRSADRQFAVQQWTGLPRNHADSRAETHRGRVGRRPRRCDRRGEGR